MLTTWAPSKRRFTIRPLTASDAKLLSLPEFPNRARVWLLSEGEPIGFVGYVPHTQLCSADLMLYVGPQFRRRGYGSYMLDFIVAQLAESGITRAVGFSGSDRSGEIAFLQRHNFDFCYRELDLWTVLPQRSPPPVWTVNSYCDIEGAERLLAIYEESCGNLPWYQPVQGPRELLQELRPDGEILLLENGDQTIAFAAVTYSGSHAQIDFAGIALPFQGAGYARTMSDALLYHFGLLGLQTAELSVWSDNKTALKIATDAGFRHIHTTHYYALELPQRYRA